MKHREPKAFVSLLLCVLRASAVFLSLVLVKILRVNSWQVRVEDAWGQPPSIHSGLAKHRDAQTRLSGAVSDLRDEIEQRISTALDRKE